MSDSDNNFVHKVITLSDGQQVFIKETAGMSMGILSDEAEQIAEQIITPEEYATKSLTDETNIDTINPSNTPQTDEDTENK